MTAIVAGIILATTPVLFVALWSPPVLFRHRRGRNPIGATRWRAAFALALSLQGFSAVSSTSDLSTAGIVRAAAALAVEAIVLPAVAELAARGVSRLRAW